MSKTKSNIEFEFVFELNSHETEIKEYIQEYMKNEIQNIHKEKGGLKNVSKAFRGVGDFGEELSTMIFPKSVCSASKGGCAFDNNEYNEEGELTIAREIKTCCLIQPKKCIQCNKKTPYFQELCIFCKQSNFTHKSDSRFSIDSKSHFKYAQYIKEYVLILIDYDNIQKQINLKVFVIDSNNAYFTNYLKNQLDKSEKSDTCNLLPYSYDFYSSGPIKIIDLIVDSDSNFVSEYINLSNTIPIDFDTSILKKKEKVQLNINERIEFMTYEEIKDVLVVRDKNLNKERGETNRI